MTQCEQVLKHLQSGKTITSMQSFRLYGITRLSDRCRDLRHKGYGVESRMITLPSKKRVAQYYLAHGWAM
jgi:hypothetical protein